MVLVHELNLQAAGALIFIGPNETLQTADL